MNLLNILIVVTSISMILYYLYETDVLWEYLNKISEMLKIKGFDFFFYGVLLLKAYPSSGNSNYLQFINKTYNSFITRLLSCPICVGFWLCFFASLITELQVLPIYCFLSLSFYYTIKILTKLSAKL